MHRAERPARILTRRLLVGLGVVGVGRGTAACADAPVASPSSPQAGTSPAVGSSPFNGSSPAQARAVDVAYARAMIPHHAQALELATLAAGRTTSPDVTDLAFRIDREQVEEVGQLQGLLRSWGVTPPADDDTGAMSGAPGMGGMDAGAMGMASPDTLGRLRAASGPAFDRLWLATMTAHHRGAIDMARAHLATGADTGLRTFSEVLVRTQQREIDRMAGVAAGLR